MMLREKVIGYIRGKYGVFAVRGPRGVPPKLSEALR